MLLKQDKAEAVMAVNGRLEFIENEMQVQRALGKTANVDSRQQAG